MSGARPIAESSPRATGPAGPQFETKVGTHYALALLASTEPFGLPGVMVDRLEFQRGGQAHLVCPHKADEIATLLPARFFDFIWATTFGQPWNARTGVAAHVVGDGYARVTRKLHRDATFSRKLRGGLAESVMPKDELQLLIDDAESYMQTLRALLHDFALSDEAYPIDTTDDEKFREMACEHDTTIRGPTASSSALRGRPLALPSAISRAQMRPASSSNTRMRSLKRVCEPSGPQNHAYRSRRFLPAGFSKMPCWISARGGTR